jgi:hypothetical protein
LGDIQDNHECEKYQTVSFGNASPCAKKASLISLARTQIRGSTGEHVGKTIREEENKGTKSTGNA